MSGFRQHHDLPVAADSSFENPQVAQPSSGLWRFPDRLQLVFGPAPDADGVIDRRNFDLQKSSRENWAAEHGIRSPLWTAPLNRDGGCETMGFENREYYREGDSLQSSDGRLTKWLIAANVLFFFAQLIVKFDGHSVATEWLRLDWQEVWNNGQVWRVVTYAFAHEPTHILNLLLNLLMLYSFGPTVERLYHSGEYLLIYLGGILATAALHLACNSLIGVQTHLMGATGAVFTICVLFAMHFPKQVVSLGIAEVETRLFILILVAFDLLIISTVAITNGTMAEVTRAAHLGGALFAWIYFRQQWKLSSLFLADRWARYFRDRARRRLLRVQPVPPESGELEIELDRVLQKIHTQGQASLTAAEQKTLQYASERFKRRQ